MRPATVGHLTAFCLLLLVAANSIAGEIYDERLVPKFDGREWVAAHANASADEVMAEYILKGEDLQHWTELVTTSLYPVKPDSGVLNMVRDYIHNNVTKACPDANWEQLYESDTLVIYAWNIEACDGPDSTEYTLTALRTGVDGVHLINYACRSGEVFKKQLPIWRELVSQAAIFRPEEDVRRLSSDLLADTTRMIHIVYRYQSEDFEDNSFAGLPRNFWRSGTKYFRGEEPPDSVRKTHGLIITSEPDAWLINRADNTGRHLVDPGPTFNTVCPVFGEMKKNGLMPLEFGKETVFFKHYGARPLADELVDNIDCRVYELPRLYWILRLYVDKETGFPYRISRRGPDGSWLSIYYKVYEVNLPIDPDLFRPDQGLEISEG